MANEMKFKKAKSSSEEEDKDLDEGSEESTGAEGAEDVAEKPSKKKGSVKSEDEADDMIGDLIEDRRYQLRPKAVATREHLASQPLVQTMIPRGENEPKDAVQSYSINGFGFYIRKGVFQKVPQQIANMISDTFGQDARVVADHPKNLKNNTAARNAVS